MMADTQAMNPGAAKGFALRDAIGTLNEAGLLQSVLKPGPGGLAKHEPPAAAKNVTSVFAGARLDSRSLTTGELFVALPGDNVHGRDFAAAWLTVGGWVLTDVAPDTDPLVGVPAAPDSGVLVCPDPQAALAELARFWRQRMPARVVGVTGTNGKTTTKDILAAALSGAGPTHATAGNFNNFLGLPLTLLGLRNEHRFAVIEMGASAEGEIDYLAGLAQPEIGIITNASPAHLAEFGSLAGIIAGKGELLDNLPQSGAVILNVDSPGWEQWQQRAHCRVVSLGQNSGDHRWASTAGSAGAALQLDQTTWTVPLPGQHNAVNLAVAILAARELGVTDQEIREGLTGFSGSPHRGIRLEIGGRIVLDDAYNANPGSMLAAARAVVDLTGDSVTSRSLAVFGHMAELGPEGPDIHRETGQRLAATGLDVLVAVGLEARPLSEGFDAAGGMTHYCPSIDEAAIWLASNSDPGDHILVKGSRSATMEKILPLLARACSDIGTQD